MMALDPFYLPKAPAEKGRVTVHDSVAASKGSHAPPPAALYYELRGPVNGEKVILLNGLFATLRSYDQLADVLADSGLRVLSFNHRHIGASRADPSEPVTPNQTCELLAKDAVALIDKVWPGASGVHVAGVSMGGMVAQHLAVLLLRQGHLASLYVAVTTGGHWAQPLMKYFPTWCLRQGLGLTVYKDKTLMAKTILHDCFTREYLNSKCTDPHGTGSRTMGELWVRVWSERFDDLFCLKDLDAAAGQLTVPLRHWLSAADAALLRASTVPKIVYVANRDAIILPKEQRRLAATIGAQCVETSKAHVEGFTDWMVAMPAFVKGAAAARAAAAAAVDGAVEVSKM